MVHAVARRVVRVVGAREGGEGGEAISSLSAVSLFESREPLTVESTEPPETRSAKMFKTAPRGNHVLDT